MVQIRMLSGEWLVRYTQLVPCKLMEKLIRDAIVKHMTENNLSSKAQHGKGKLLRNPTP